VYRPIDKEDLIKWTHVVKVVFGQAKDEPNRRVVDDQRLELADGKKPIQWQNDGNAK
jgi:hypothetical protein